MPRFAANLSMMFTEVPFIERFAAARKAGFDAVEFLFPYDYSPQQIQQQLVQNHLTLALFNTAPGDINAGEWGLSALPGREHEARADIDLALEYALALNCEQVHVMAGVVPAGEDAERYGQYLLIISATLPTALRHTASEYWLKHSAPALSLIISSPASIRHWLLLKRLREITCLFN